MSEGFGSRRRDGLPTTVAMHGRYAFNLDLDSPALAIGWRLVASLSVSTLRWRLAESPKVSAAGAVCTAIRFTQS